MAKVFKTHAYFKIGIIFKAVFAVLELLGGLILYLISGDSATRLLLVLTQHELIEDPHDLVANYLHTASGIIFGGTQHFAAVYLFGHGAVKMIALVGLLRNKRWAYPVSFIVFGCFIVYQLYRFTWTHSAWLLVLTALDAVIIWLIWQEFKQVSKEKL